MRVDVLVQTNLSHISTNVWVISSASLSTTVCGPACSAASIAVVLQTVLDPLAEPSFPATSGLVLAGRTT